MDPRTSYPDCNIIQCINSFKKGTSTLMEKMLKPQEFDHAYPGQYVLIASSSASWIPRWFTYR